MQTLLLGARLLLAAVLLVASVAKLLDLRGSKRAVTEFGVPARLAAPVGAVLPFAELAIALALLPAGSARYGAIAAAALLTVFALAIARSVARGEAPDCHCFGQLHSAPAGWRALVRNAVLAGLAVFVVAGGWRRAGPSATAWAGELSDAAVVALAGGLVIALLAACAAVAWLALLRQNGGLLLRLEALQARLDAVAGPAPVSAAQPHRGLALGELAPPFTLGGLYGESATLDSLTAGDTPLLLVFTDPRCGPCNALMPQVSSWQQEHAGRLSIAVLTRGSIEENRAEVQEHGVGSIWIDEGLEVYGAYRAHATPGAVLIDAQGKIASPVVAGAEAIAELVAHSNGASPTQVALPIHHAAPHPAAPSVPAVGSPAPSLQLRDLADRPVSLVSSERDTLVLFWDPSCGFCAQMLDDVRAFDRSPPPGAPRLVLISRGSAEDNADIGIAAPIVLDNALMAGAAFGTTATPVAIVIDRRGNVASELGIGRPGVMALASGVEGQLSTG
jgi:thiol-disulfide isomerase/thioredoxin/uncharacterized membrane protein YphA (DoxX/SURF4 family)